MESLDTLSTRNREPSSRHKLCGESWQKDWELLESLVFQRWQELIQRYMVASEISWDKDASLWSYAMVRHHTFKRALGCFV